MLITASVSGRTMRLGNLTARRRQRVQWAVYAVETLENRLLLSTATQLAFGPLPGGLQAGSPIVPSITVDVEDASGDVVSTDDSNVTLSVQSGPGGLLGNLAVAAVNGVASFPGRSLNAAGTYTLAAADSNAGVTGAVSSDLAVSAAGPIFVTNEGSNTIGQYTTGGATVNPSLVTGLDAPESVAVSGSDLFVANEGSGTIGEYTTSGATVNAQLVSGLDSPEGIAVSGSDLFVANDGSNTIGEYTTSGATVNAQLVSGLSYPAGIAVSGSDLFVANDIGIGEYTTSGGTVNAQLISYLHPTGIAISGSDLFVTSGPYDEIGEYTTSGATVNAELVSSGLDYPWSIAVSGSDLFVTNYESSTIGEYTTSGATVNAQLVSDPDQPYAVAVFGSDLFVANVNSGTIGEYTTSGATVNPSLVSGPDYPEGIAVSGSDLFVTNSESNTIGEYTTSGATVNAQLISYPHPTGIAISGSDLFVASLYGNTIGEYTTSGGIVNPQLVSGLDGPEGIAVSGSDLFVVNNGSGTIGEYTISGATVKAKLVSGLDSPEGIAVSGSDLFVVNEGSSRVGEYTTSGATVRAVVVSALGGAYGIAVSGSDLFVTNIESDTIGEYSTSGAFVNLSLISGLSNPDGIWVGPPQPVGSAAQLDFGSLPETFDSALPLFTVNVEDDYGNIVTSDDSEVTLSIASGPAGAMLGGTLTAPVINGVATFSNITVNTGGAYKLQATDDTESLMAGVSGILSIALGPPAQLAFGPLPGGQVAGPIPPITVDVEDAIGGVVYPDDSNVTLSVQSGPGALLGTLTVAAVNGVATFPGLSLNAAGTYTLAAADSNAGVTGAVSSDLAVSAAGPIFVANTGSNSIGQYITSGATVNAQLDAAPLDDPEGIAISGSDLFVTNFGSNTIGEYTTSGATVNAALVSGLDSPEGIAVSGSDLFVANYDSGTIGEYTTSGATVNAQLVSGLGNPTGIAVSGSDLFVTNYAGMIGEYTTSGATVNAQLVSGLYEPTCIAVSGSDLFVASAETDSIAEYTTSGATVNAQLFYSGLDAPKGIAVSGSDLFVTNYESGTIGEYTTSGATVDASLISGLSYPIGIWVGPPQPVGPAAELDFSSLPGTFDGALPPLAVNVEDDYDNIVTSDDSEVTLSIASGPAGAMLSGTLTAPVVNGVATFSNITVNTAGTYMLQVTDTADNLPAGTSPSIVAQQGIVLWTGSDGTANWNDPANWADDAVPTASTNVAVPPGANVQLGPGTSVCQSLLIQGSGTLDLETGALQIDYGAGADPISSIRSYLDGGYNHGAWTGTGIVSSAAAANPTAYTVGYADGDNSVDAANTGTPAGEIKIMYTVAGDANLSSGVDLSDLVIVASDFGKSGADWAEGDLNYDGDVNLSDLVIVASNFGASVAAQSAEDSTPSAVQTDEVIASPAAASDNASPAAQPATASQAEAPSAGNAVDWVAATVPAFVTPRNVSRTAPPIALPGISVLDIRAYRTRAVKKSAMPTLDSAATSQRAMQSIFSSVPAVDLTPNANGEVVNDVWDSLSGQTKGRLFSEVPLQGDLALLD
jgi:hypothetical protein